MGFDDKNKRNSGKEKDIYFVTHESKSFLSALTAFCQLSFSQKLKVSSFLILEMLIKANSIVLTISQILCLIHLRVMEMPCKQHW